MNWKDTVRNNEEETRKSVRFMLGAANAQSAFEEYIKSRINAQAEITGPIAEKAGIQKVLDWMKTNSEIEKCDPDTEAYFNTYRWISEEGWQAFLKEVEK